MADKVHCYACNSYSSSVLAGFRDNGKCPFCGATLALNKIIGDAMEKHYEELEAAGVNLYATNVERPAIVTYLISLWHEKQELKAQNRVLMTSISNIDAAVSSVKRAIRG